ncbi:universal stress protein [Chitinophaga sp. 212800010-3]|uniref:universal stress protein n=1 Tax=unclassified Chitinophaga TaxID=2619133 RepID=UPI002DE63A67|nr:Universal stress protein [Chitinophaga sp. 212800010-3]
MEKILYVTDAVKLNRVALEFACYLCNLTHSKLTGVFLENKELELRSGEYIREMAEIPEVPGAELAGQKELYRDDSICRFRNICEVNGVNNITHTMPGLPSVEVIKESRYADLIVIDASSSFSWKTEAIPSSFVRSVLRQAECPVVLAPESFDGIDEIVFAYNGSRASMFAIKQFTYLFPQFRGHRVKLLSIIEERKTVRGDEEKLKEWLDCHYEKVSVTISKDDNMKAGLLEKLFGNDSTFIVMGAFGRSSLAELFIPNPAIPVVKLVTQPIFISHY